MFMGPGVTGRDQKFRSTPHRRLRRGGKFGGCGKELGFRHGPSDDYRKRKRIKFPS